MSVPRSLLRALGAKDQYGRPHEVAAANGSRFYDATAFSLSNPVSPTQDVQSFLYPVDNTAAFDFVLRSATAGTPYPDPVVLLTKDGPITARAGSSFVYQVSYTNLGPASAGNARIVDRLPAELAYVSSTHSGTWNASARTVTWNVGTVPVNGTGTVAVTVRVTAATGTPLVNSADFTAVNTVSPPTATSLTTVVP
jgi:uncharacterized repeat protein (TIGR01451 family)